MVDIQATAEMISWAVKGLTVILMIAAASLAIKKKNNVCLGVAIVGNLLVYFLTLSPLLCWIVSIACIMWASSSKSPEQKQSLKSSKTSVSNSKKMVKPGTIIGLILGIGLVVFPIMGFVNKEASLSDSTGQLLGIGFIVFGALMVIGNIITLAKGGEPIAASTVTTVVQSSSKAKTEAEENEKKIRCRFCKKLYSAEYNGCPHCKKK